MKHISHSILALIMGLAAALPFSACQDDTLLFSDPGEGEAEIAASVAFEPLAAALGDHATRTPGNAIKEISSLSVLVYTPGNELVKVFNKADLLNYSYRVDGNKDMPLDEDGNPIGEQAEATTARASFSLPTLPYGRYRIYAVANMGDITMEEAADIDNLKEKLLEWNADDIAANCQMFGYFTAADDTNNGSYGFEAPIVTISRENKSLHAWIKRAVSKVTVAFDPSGLHQDVWIYIHDVTIRDIPKYCCLGKNNEPTSLDSMTNAYNVPLKDLPASSRIIFNKNGDIASQPGASDPGADTKFFEQWLPLAKGTGVKGSDHSETANALYFFENMQGDYDGQKAYDKRQQKDDVGQCIVEPQDGKDYKDKVTYGSYVEVTGYYVSNNPQNTTRGKIKYRFMLGKNDTYNYNAQRNHHFKLTLGFKGWANQPDWHIQYYEEDPGLYVPDEFFVSYLYNQKHMMPMKIVGNCTGLKMEIVENNWAPYDPSKAAEVPAPTVGAGAYAFKWNRKAWNSAMYRQYPVKETDTEFNNPTQFGFLALAVPVNSGQVPKNIIDMDFSKGTEAQNALDTYFDTNNGVKSWNTGSQSVRSFTATQLDPKGGTGTGQGAGCYYKGYNGWQVHEIDDDSKMLLVPLFTRNKSMINGTGFSGNNPYDSYQRKAVVRVTATFLLKGGSTKTIVKHIPVYQVRRVVNPKGVWHKYDDNNDFHVKLMRINDVSATSSPNYFSEFNSEGAWRAYVEIPNTGTNFLGLEPSGKSYQKGDTIYGDTDTPIDFVLKFKGVPQNTTKCAVVRIDYHGNNCVHKIMVRQGYLAPLAVADGGEKWSSFSLFSCSANSATTGSPRNIAATLTCNPLALGSFFKRHNTREGIRIINNNSRGPLIAPDGYRFLLTDGSYKTWGNINWDDVIDDYTSTWGTFTSTVQGIKKNYRLPTYEDFKALEESEFGFGVLYTDKTYEVQPTYDGAYGYQAPNNLEDGPDTGKGARGIIVYNRTNANQIFFPVGKNGMGRRTQFNVRTTSGGINEQKYRGVLRYGDTSYVLDGAGDIYRPIPYNLPYSPGAIYWLNTTKENGSEGAYPSSGYDMNYFNFDFNPYPDNTYGTNWGRIGDARPIKLIVTS